MRRLDRPIRRYKRKWPRRVEQLVDDVAALVPFLPSDDAGYITGETMHVNGGLYMA